MKVTRTSPYTGKTRTMDLDITEEQLVRWKNGELIQDVFAHLSKDEREFLKTGLTQEDWDKMFDEEEGDDWGNDLDIGDRE